MNLLAQHTGIDRRDGEESMLRRPRWVWRGILALTALALSSGAAFADTLYQADLTSGRIYSYTSGGVQSTFASLLNSPYDVVFDAQGDIFESDSADGIVYEFPSGGGQTTYTSGLNHPQGLAIYGSLVYEADSGTGMINILNSNGTTTLFASGFNAPAGLAIDSSGNVYEADSGGNKIYKITPGGTKTLFVNTGLHQPQGLTFDSSGNLYVADSGSGSILSYDALANKTVYETGLTSPRGVAFDDSGNLFVSDFTLNAIYEYTAASQSLPTPFASGLNHPSLMAFASSGAASATPEPRSFSLVLAAVLGSVVMIRMKAQN